MGLRIWQNLARILQSPEHAVRLPEAGGGGSNGLKPPAASPQQNVGLEALWEVFFMVLGGLWGGFCRSGVPLETCLGDLGGLLWIHGNFFGHLGGFGCDFGWLWGPFGRILGAFWDH